MENGTVKISETLVQNAKRKAKKETNEREIIRYKNRKLYDVHASKYVNLKNIAKMIQDGLNVKVYANGTDKKAPKKDITQLTKVQVILDAASRLTENDNEINFLTNEEMDKIICKIQEPTVKEVQTETAVVASVEVSASEIGVQNQSVAQHFN